MPSRPEDFGTTQERVDLYEKALAVAMYSCVGASCVFLFRSLGWGGLFVALALFLPIVALSLVSRVTDMQTERWTVFRTGSSDEVVSEHWLG